MLDNQFVGFNLSAGFCAEHEWGINKIRNYFGMDTMKKGIDKRRVTKYPEGEIKTIDYKKAVYLIFNPMFSYSDIPIAPSDELKLYPNNDISAAWDESSFAIGISAKNKGLVNRLNELHRAFQRKDISIWLGGRTSPIGNSGLIIAITSKVLPSIKDDMKKADIDHENLLKAAQDTGIHDILRKADKGYMALSPRWKDKSKKEVIFWLNPMDQQNNNFGWYGVEELKLWTNDKGKIPKKGETK